MYKPSTGTWFESHAVPGFVKAPAFALMTVAGIGVLVCLISTTGAVFGFHTPFQTGGHAHAGSAVVDGGLATTVGMNLTALVLQALTIFGAQQMLQGRRYGLAIASSILAMTPCMGPSCVIGIAAGVWSLVVLSRRDVKALFE